MFILLELDDLPIVSYQFTLLPVVVTLTGFNCPSGHLRINVGFGDMTVNEMSSKC